MLVWENYPTVELSGTIIYKGSNKLLKEDTEICRQWANLVEFILKQGKTLRETKVITFWNLSRFIGLQKAVQVVQITYFAVINKCVNVSINFKIC